MECTCGCHDLPVKPVVDDHDLLRFHDRWVALGPVEARVARTLTEHVGELVPRPAIEAVAWPGRPVRANTIDRQLHRLRAHVAAVGLVLTTVRGRGYILEVLRDLT
jgi:DNA-binding winged helix-turn-helix (wHTH) protein